MFTRLARRPLWTWIVSICVGLLVVFLSRHFGLQDTHGVSHANLFLTTDWLIMKSLDRLLNKLAIAATMNTEDEDDFRQKFPVGSTIRKKYPWRATSTTGLGWAPQSIERISTTLSVDQIIQISFDYDSYEKAVLMERGEAFLEREYIDPCMDEAAQQIESRAALWAYQNASNVVGALGTDPTTFDASSAAARQMMVENGCPVGKERGLFVPPSVMRALKGSSLTYFNPVKDIEKQFRTGIVGSGDGFEWYESVSLYSHTAGTWAGAVTVNGAGQSGSAITITATAGDTFKKGDKVSFASVNRVNPQTRRRVGASAKTFSVTQDLTAAGAGVDVLYITPAIFGPGSNYQNVDALPAHSAALTLWPGTTSPNGKSGTVALALHPDAYAMASIPFEVPKAAEPGTGMKTDSETGLSIAFLRMMDPRTRVMINRFDFNIGFGNYYNDACAVAIACA